MQTYSNLEYIVIDGNSTDGTLDVIRKHNSLINIFVSEPDNGLYDAMNKGIALATGEIIGILNSDDTFYSNSVVAEIAAFHTSNNIDASVGNVIQHNPTGKQVRMYTSKYWTPQKLKIGLMPPHPSIFFKIDLFQKFENYKICFKIASDFELITRFFLKNNLNWMYSNITTTSMLVGGLSSSGVSSYNLITNEIQKALFINHITYSPFLLKIRFIWKLNEFFQNKKI